LINFCLFCFSAAYRMAQLFYGMGTTGLFICAAASFLYTINKYRSVTGNIMVAGFLLPSGMSLL